MPANKNAVTRYHVLDRCFSNQYRRYYMTDLIDECSKILGYHVCRKTIFNDISYMECEYGFDLQRIKDEGGKRVYYRYSDPDFSINNSPLSSAEICQLNSAIETLSQFKGLPQFDWIEEIIHKLQLSSNSRSNEIVGFDNNPYLKGRDYIGTIYQSILHMMALKVTYQAFSWREPRTMTFHPHYLRQYNNRWFVFGYNADFDYKGWNMALDRIQEIVPAENIMYIGSDIRWSEYFEDIIGVTNNPDTEVETIILHCFGITGKYIENKPIHESQRIKWIGDECLEVKLSVKQNFELVSYILSQGSSIKVISPESLRDKITKTIANMRDLYNDI